MSEARSKHRIPLSEWIRPFQTFDYTTAPSTDSDSLIPALRLACSIADEICKVEEETGQLPTPCSDWIDSIVVYSQSSSPKKDGIEHDIFDTILTDYDGSRVEILPSLFDKTDNDDARQMDGILYSLGIVFFEIFLGGERPVELEQKQIGETTNYGFETAGTEELSEGFNPFHQGGTIDSDSDGAELSIYQNLLSDYNLSDDDSTSYEEASSK